MNFVALFDIFGEPGTIALGAALIGLVFGFAAERTQFCLRSAVIDVTGSAAGDGSVRWRRLALWSVVFGAAIASTQWLVSSHAVDLQNVRQFTSARSLSGVLIGGLVFGAGAVLTRGCISRLTVLSGTGNLRAVYALVVFTAVAFATFDGFLSPLRQQVLGLWTLGPDSTLNLLYANDLTALSGVALGAAVAAVAGLAVLALRLGIVTLALGVVLGGTIAAGWWLTYTLSGQVFEPIAVESVSFTRPAIDAVSLGAGGFGAELLTFGIGILGGVPAGAFLAALLAGGLKLQWFDSLAHAGRFTTGAVLMGFGGVVAGGCSVGAGLTGGSLLALTSLLAVAAMAAGMAVTDLALARAARGGRGSGEVRPAPAE